MSQHCLAGAPRLDWPGQCVARYAWQHQFVISAGDPRLAGQTPSLCGVVLVLSACVTAASTALLQVLSH